MRSNKICQRSSSLVCRPRDIIDNILAQSACFSCQPRRGNRLGTRTAIGVMASNLRWNITVQPNNPVAGAQFNLSFNPSLVTINSVTEGNLFNQGGASTYFMAGTINNAAGT